MPPLSPLPQRHGLDAAWLRTPDRTGGPPAWTTMGAWLRERLPERAGVDRLLTAERFVYADAQPVRDGDPYRPHTFVWFHRDLREEPAVPGRVELLFRDERIVVVDKPAFLSTIPRGRHVRESVVVRLRDELGLPELTPAHRLDRVTSGVLVLTTERRWRADYQLVFQERQARKIYRALAAFHPDLSWPVTVRDHLRKRRGAWQVEVVPDAPVNAVSEVELETRLGDQAVYRIAPRTGQTHQIRRHLCDLGIPIAGDPLYPEVRDVDVDDFSEPLQLLAAELGFTDPVDGSVRRFTSRRTLPLPSTLIAPQEN